MEENRQTENIRALYILNTKCQLRKNSSDNLAYLTTKTIN